MKISIKGWERKGGAENGPPSRAGLSLVQYLSSSPRFNPSYTQTASPIYPPPWCHSQPACSNTHRLAAFIVFVFISKDFPAASYILSIFVVVLFISERPWSPASGCVIGSSYSPSGLITRWWPVIFSNRTPSMCLFCGGCLFPVMCSLVLRPTDASREPGSLLPLFWKWTPFLTRPVSVQRLAAPVYLSCTGVLIGLAPSPPHTATTHMRTLAVVRLHNSFQQGDQGLFSSIQQHAQVHSHCNKWRNTSHTCMRTTNQIMFFSTYNSFYSQ